MQSFQIKETLQMTAVSTPCSTHIMPKGVVSLTHSEAY